MKKNVILLCLMCIISFPTVAQNVFWQEDFSNGIPGTWTNEDVNANPYIWLHDPIDGGAPSWFGQPEFSSQTVDNGFVFYDSDESGEFVFHDVRLTTNAIDCSNQSNVIVRFENQYAYYSPSPGAQAFLGVSTDGLTFTYIELFTDLAPDDLSNSLQVVQEDVSSLAANNATVYLQFRWVGNWEYDWKIDDIRLQDQAEFIYDLSIGDYSRPPFFIPAILADSFVLGCEVINIGNADQSAINVEVEVEKNGSSFYNESLTISTLNSGEDSILIYENNPLVIQGVKEDIFSLSYTIESLNTDISQDNNSVNTEFVLTENEYGIDNGVIELEGIRPEEVDPNVGTVASYFVGNYYNITKEEIKANEAVFSVDAVTGPLTGKELSVLLYKVVDNGDNVFDNNDLLILSINDFTLSNEFPLSLITVPLFDINTAELGVPLEQGESYILGLSIPMDSGLRFGYSAGLDYGLDYSTFIGNTNSAGNTQWYLGGFGSDIQAVIRMIISFPPVSTEKANLFPDECIIYPNPSDDYIIVSWETKNTHSARLSINNLVGQEIYSNLVEVSGTGSLEIDVKSIPSGQYLLSILGDELNVSKLINIK